MKINSWSWSEKDDPMFTGGFKVHSVRVKDSGQKKKKKDRIKYDKNINNTRYEKNSTR